MVARTQPQRKPQNESSAPSPWAGKVHVVELYSPSYPTKRVLSCATVAIGRAGEIPSLTISGIRILDGKHGFWAAWPSEKRGDEWAALVEPSEELGREIQRVVIAAFEASNADAPLDDNEIPF